MMRWLGGVVVIALMVPALAASAQSESYRDDFGSVSYSNNDGSLEWSASWSEIGESNGPGSGQVQVSDGECSNNKCLRMKGGLLGTVGASRPADLSGFVDARLQYDLAIDAALLSTGKLFVETRGGGSGWHALDSYTLLLDEGEHTGSFDVSADLGPDFEVRFRLTGLLGGDVVYVDRVTVEGAVVPPTTTTSSTTSTSTTSTIAPGSPTSTISVTTSSTTSSGVPTSSTPTTVPRGPATTSTTSSGSTDAIPGQPGGESQTTTTTGEGSETTIGRSGPPVPTTTTTSPASTTSTEPGAAVNNLPTPPPNSGLRQARVGLLADYRAGMMGELEIGEIEVLGADLSADFSMAVEAFEAGQLWIAALALLIAAAVVSGMDRRRAKVQT